MAWQAFSAHNLPDGMEAMISGEATVDPEGFSYPHGTHLAAMEVGTETGRVRLRKSVRVEDVDNREARHDPRSMRLHASHHGR